MTAPPILENEDRRLRRLMGLDILDTEAEAVLDAITRLAASIAGTPVALISLVDANRQWWKSAVGLPQGGGTEREISFCGHAIASDELFEVEDATADPRFSDNPIVTGSPRIVHYAGVPLVMPGGERMGTLCVIEHQPGRISERVREQLSELARCAVGVLLLRESERRLRSKDGLYRALRESEAKFRTIANAMPQMVWSATAEGRHDYFNQRWYAFTGTRDDGADWAHWVTVFHPEDAPRLRAAWRDSLDTGQAMEIECRLRHHSGEFRWVLCRALPVRGADDAVIRWMGTCTDVHDQHLAREELQNANRMKDEFLAMLAHELRNPLAPITTAAHLLEVNPSDAAKVQSHGEMIGRQARHMTTLVNDLLDVSRVTRGLVRIESELVDLKDVIHTALEQARPQIVERRHRVDVQLCPERAWVMGDRVRLVQVLSNLLHNACKYTAPQGRIGVSLAVEAGKARIEVEDNGAGIDAQLLPHVFGLFTQAKRTPDRAQGGLGLGLALVKSLVELHQGSVSGRSGGSGQGAVFTVILPLTEADGATLQKARETLRVAGRRLNVMVVDDNADAAQSLATWLEAQGHRVVVMHDPVAALEAARADPAEVYLLDIGLPGMDGHALARALRRQEAPGRRAMLIALTGYGQPSDLAQSREAGIDHHLVKPMDPAVLSGLLAQAAADGGGPGG